VSTGLAVELVSPFICQKVVPVLSRPRIVGLVRAVCISVGSQIYPNCGYCRGHHKPSCAKSGSTARAPLSPAGGQCPDPMPADHK